MQENRGIEEEKSITGKVLAIFFQNTTNYYKVILIKVMDTSNLEFSEKEVVVTGHFGQIQEELTYQFYGHLTTHVKYGLQFNALRYEEEKPTDKVALIDYFSSDKFSGIGKVTAQKLIDSLGNHAIEEIEDNPDVLQKVSGLTKKQKDTIAAVVANDQGTNKTLFFLQKNGFGTALAYKIMDFYKEQTWEILKENPYRLIEDIENVGFNRADVFAENLGIEADAAERLKASLFFSLQKMCMSNGNTYALENELLAESRETLEKSRPFLVRPELLETALEEMVVEKRIIKEADAYFIPSLYISEMELAVYVDNIVSYSKELVLDDQKLEKELSKLEKKLNISYGDTQKEAIKYAIKSPLFILTGGPGTGKTTVIEGIVELFSEMHQLNLDELDVNDEAFPVLLAAPTGRAAKRMNETTGLPSSTIHRLLGLTGNDENENEEYGRELKGKLLIVDEMSMVDTWLANKLFQSIPDGMHVILVGDRDQLPSVGPGQVLHDFLLSGRIPAVELKEIYRQEDGSTIIPLAHHIKQNEYPPSLTENKRDRSFFECDSTSVLPVISQVVEKAIAKGFSPQDIQILAPMYRGPAGIDVMNKHLQELLNPNPSGRRKEIVFGDKIYRIGDKVLQLVNDTELGVFNGDMGEVTGITYAKESPNKTDELTLLFDQKEVTYQRQDWKKITLAYCVSIHKAQGSEFKLVILPLVSYFGRMLRKDLLYTAITRASELLILCGEPEAYRRCIESGSAKRKTKLMERMLALLDTQEAIELGSILSLDEEEAPVENSQETTAASQEKTFEDIRVEEQKEEYPHPIYQLTKEKIKKGEISPMIGMDTLTPYSFKED